MPDTLAAYTDGSCLPHPRRGGIGIRFVFADALSGEEVTRDFSPPGYPGATNQEMEILACVEALTLALETRWPQRFSRLVIFTDSSYVQQNYKRAIFEWPKRKWERSSGAPVENAEDWKRLAKCYKKALIEFSTIRLEWVAGHSTNSHNKVANRLARASARNPLNAPRKVVHVRRKYTAKALERGSVQMNGQTMTIYVYNSSYLKLQKLWRCKYVVISENSSDFGNVDILFTDKPRRLDAGHTYIVRVNSDSNNPRVAERLEEVPTARRITPNDFRPQT